VYIGILLGLVSFMPKTRKLRLFGLIVLIVLSVILLTAGLLNSYLSKRVLSSLKERVEEGSHGEYTIAVDELSVHILDRSVTIENLIVAPTEKNITAKKAGYVIKASSLKVIGFSLIPYFKNKDLKITSIQFDKPEISIFQKQGKSLVEPKDSLSEPFSLYEMIAAKLNSLSIDKIDIDNAKINIYRSSVDTIALLSAKENSVSIRKFTVDARNDHTDHLFSAEKFEIIMNSFSYHLPDGMYTVFGKRLYTSYIDSVISVDSFQLVPNFPKKEFGKKLGKQTSRVSIVSSTVNFTDIDVKHFLEQNSFIAGKLSLKGFIIDVYRDNNVPLAKVVRPSLQSMIRDIPIFVSIDTIEMFDATAQYEDLAQGATASGIMTFDKINGTITGIISDSSFYTDKSEIKASINAVFMKEGSFSATYHFPLNTRDEMCYCSGYMNSMSIMALNPLLESTKGISVKTGNIDSMKFKLNTNGIYSDGAMTMAYHGLSVKILSEEKGKHLQTKLKNFVANEFIIKESNPGKDGNLRTVHIGVQKNQYRYFPYFFMQSLLSGIAASLEGEKKARFLKRTRLLEKK